MTNKGEDSNTTTDDNISLNEVNWLNLDLHALFSTLHFRYVSIERTNRTIIVTPTTQEKQKAETQNLPNSTAYMRDHVWSAWEIEIIVISTWASVFARRIIPYARDRFNHIKT